MADRARYPKGHTFSASTLKTIRMCMLRHWLRKVHRYEDPAGPQARVGKLVHRVFEVAALRRLEPEPGEEPPGPIADFDELTGILKMEIDGEGAWVVKAARACLETAVPFDLENVHAAEGIIEKFEIAEGVTVGGIIDRTDTWDDEEETAHACITDYKTGYIPPREELEESEQTTIYLAWAADEFGIYDDNLVLVYYWPGEDIRIAIRYDAETIQLGIDNMLRDWERWDSGDWPKTDEGLRQFHVEQGDDATPPRPPATLGVHCSHCPFRDQCGEYQEHIRKPARVHPWAGMVLPELAELRHQVAGDAKMLETARKELDRYVIDSLSDLGDLDRMNREQLVGLIEFLGREVPEDEARPVLLALIRDATKGDKWEDEDYSMKIQRDRLTNYTMGVVEALANATGLELEDVMRQVCSISTSKVRAFVGKMCEEHPRVKRVADVYETPSMKSPYVRCRAKGGLF